MKFYLGIDIGSIAAKVVVLNDAQEVIEEYYRRTAGEPIKTIKPLLEELNLRHKFSGIATTGSGGKLIVGEFVNEVIAQAEGISFFYPEIKTVIEMGGEDSKLLIMADGKLIDFATNSACVLFPDPGGP